MDAVSGGISISGDELHVPTDEERKLRKQLTDILFEHNPGRIPLIYIFPRDEYDPEVDLILPELENCESEEDVLELVHGVFVRMFDESWVGPKSKFELVAKEIWQVVLLSRE